MELKEIYRQIDLFRDSEHPINEILDQLKENIAELYDSDV